jgi:hypothetical protein
MRNSFAIVATAFVLSSSYAFAQAPQDRSDGPRPFAFSREDAGALIDARIAALHSGLKLTADQERMWPAFEQAYRDLAKLRLDRAAGATAPPSADDPIARMGRRADDLAKRGAALKSFADAAAPLWQSFDDGQKRRFALLARPFGGRLSLSRRYEDRFGPRFGPGFGPGRDGFGPPGRDGDRFGPDRRGFGPYGPRFGEDGYGRDRGGFGPGRRFGRDGDEFGFGRAPRDFYPGPRGGGGGDDYGYAPRRRDRDYGRDDDRYYGRDPDREFGNFRRGPWPWWRPNRERFWREGRDWDDRDVNDRDLNDRDLGGRSLGESPGAGDDGEQL